ncbi:CHP02436-containing protein [Caldithrix abyssi DSM 13497]|uniref:CHP02436-containing protein n=1 Tax=Caldithrix abyssi DSM 13497 TaxID=880073 RepID=H1XP59_CALAY|nr:four helix bundle protein [Caldithrix abyssi]APF18142.1 four helix bundle protein [Caldithrix abyssi DSM 13497]EHO42174.1 CHP02436-containing protein [Caldithrix abyssi DSM 13497]
MKENNLIRNKSYQFALKIINIYKFLQEEKREFLLSKQLLRSGTSIGANIEEAIGGQSKKDFYAKLSIAYKESRETHYWIRLLRDSGYLNAETAKQLLEDCDELLRILGSIQLTIQKKL